MDGWVARPLRWPSVLVLWSCVQQLCLSEKTLRASTKSCLYVGQEATGIAAVQAVPQRTRDWRIGGGKIQERTTYGKRSRKERQNRRWTERKEERARKTYSWFGQNWSVDQGLRKLKEMVILFCCDWKMWNSGWSCLACSAHKLLLILGGGLEQEETIVHQVQRKNRAHGEEAGICQVSLQEVPKKWAAWWSHVCVVVVRKIPSPGPLRNGVVLPGVKV